MFASVSVYAAYIIESIVNLLSIAVDAAEYTLCCAFFFSIMRQDNTEASIVNQVAQF